MSKATINYTYINYATFTTTKFLGFDLVDELEIFGIV